MTARYVHYCYGFVGIVTILCFSRLLVIDAVGIQWLKEELPHVRVYRFRMGHEQQGDGRSVCMCLC